MFFRSPDHWRVYLVMWTSHDCVKHKAPYILHFTTTVQLDLYTACTSIYYIHPSVRFDSRERYGSHWSRLHELTTSVPAASNAGPCLWLRLKLCWDSGTTATRPDHPKIQHMFFCWCSCCLHSSFHFQSSGLLELQTTSSAIATLYALSTVEGFRQGLPFLQECLVECCWCW